MSPDGFAEFWSSLLREFETWELPHMLLKNSLRFPDEPVDLDSLTKAAREAYLKAHSILEESETSYPEEHFQMVALHALSVLQRKAVELFERGENDKGFILLRHDSHITWKALGTDIVSVSSPPSTTPLSD